MNKNTIIGLVLIFAIMMGYMYFEDKRLKEKQAQEKKEQQNRKPVEALQDSAIRDSIDATIVGKDTAVVAKKTAPDVPEADTVSLPEGPFGLATRGETSYYWLESDILRIKIASKGGRPVEVELKEYKTFDTLPLILFKEAASRFSLQIPLKTDTIQTEQYHFMPVWYDKASEGKDSMLTGNDVFTFGMRLYPYDTAVSRDQFIEYQYSVEKGSYMVGFHIIFQGMHDLVQEIPDLVLPLTWNAELQRQEKTSSVLNGTTVYYREPDEKVKFLSESKTDDVSLSTHVKWLSFKQAFFTTVLIADDYFTNADAKVVTVKKHKDPRYLRSLAATIGLPYPVEERNAIAMRFYFGPNKYKTLRQYDLNLERQIPMGWSFFLMQWINRYAVIPVFNWLEQTGMNYGIIILLLTLMLKAVLFPIAYKTYVSSAKMRVLKPEVDEINKKFPKKEDAMKKQQAVMALYKSVGVNPMAGCVPQLLQFPILLAMFRFFPAAFELRQQSFLWAHDLSSYDSILSWNTHIWLLSDVYGNHVSLFTLLMTISTIIYSRINNQMMAGSSQMPGMKLMMYLMPVMFLGIFNNYSSGLSYYYLLANLITFGQMFIIRQFVDEEKLRAKLQANKQKPVKKSNFQKRLEEAARQRGVSYKPKKK